MFVARLHEMNILIICCLCGVYVCVCVCVCVCQLHDINQDKLARLYADLRKASEEVGGVPIAVRHIESILRMVRSSWDYVCALSVVCVEE